MKTTPPATSLESQTAPTEEVMPCCSAPFDRDELGAVYVVQVAKFTVGDDLTTNELVESWDESLPYIDCDACGERVHIQGGELVCLETPEVT